MSSRSPFSKSSLWKKHLKPPKQATSNTSLIAVVGVAAILLVILGGLVGARASPPPPTSVAVAPTSTPFVVTPTSDPATPTPVYTSAATYLKVITDQEAQGKWSQAAENAASALSDPSLSPQDKATLAQKYVTDAMEGLYGRKAPPDKATQEDIAKQYQTIMRNSARYGAELPNPLGVAQRAAEGGKFLLAKAAWDDAIQDGSFNTADINLVDSYADNLTSIGIWWTQDRTSADFNEGLTFLSAANQISLKYETGGREAWGKLRELLGTDEPTWPPPIDTPLLKTK